MKIKKLLLTALCAVLSVGAWAEIDVTASYVGDLGKVIQGSHNCNNKHKVTDAGSSQGDGWYNTQTLPNNAWHAFAGCVNGGTGESWTAGIGTAGVMMGRRMTLPVGKYTLTYEAFGTTASNASDKTASTAGDVVAFCTGKEDVDITNTTLGGNAFHSVSFNLDITTPNTVIDFGIKKVTNDSKSDWCQVKNVKLVLTSTNITPVPNNDIAGWTYSGNQTWHTNTWSTEGNKDNTNFITPFSELWVASGNKLNQATIERSFTPDQNGVYKITAWVRTLKENGGTPTGLNLYIGDVKINACAGTAITNGTIGTYTTMADGVSGTPVKFGFEVEENATLNWLSFKNVTIEYIGTLPQTDIDALIATVPTGKMNADVQTQLNAKVTALQTNATVANYNDLLSYIAVANASIIVYSNTKAAIEKYNLLASKCILAEYQEYYDISEIETGYENSSLTEDKTSAIKEKYDAAFNKQAEADHSLSVCTKTLVAGDYYIQNVATGLFLGGGNNFGTRGSIIPHGIPFTLAVNGEKYTLDSHTYNNDDNHFFDGSYVDAATKDLTITAVDAEAGIFSISSGDNAYVIADPESYVVSANNADSKLAQWKFISYNDRLLNMKADITAGTAADATWYIKEANISRNLAQTRISGTVNRAWKSPGTIGGKSENMCMEYYNQTPALVYQDIAVPNGTYTLTCQGFYRIDKSGEVTVAHLYAKAGEKEYKQNLKNLRDDNPDGINNMDQASAAFTSGRYVNTLQNIIVTDNHLRVGVQTNSVAGNWTIFDNFTLTLTASNALDVAPVIEDGNYKLMAGGKFIKVGGSEKTEAGMGDYAEASEVEVKTNCAGISTIKFTSANHLFWNEEKVYTDAPIQAKKATHHPFWLIKADGTIHNIEADVNLKAVETNATCDATGSAWTFVNAVANMTCIAGEHATFCAPFDVELPNVVVAYDATIEGNMVKLTAMELTNDILPAGTPVILYSEEGLPATTFYGKKTVAGETCESDALMGLYVAGVVPQNYYALQGSGAQEAFYKIGTSNYAGKANRCYLKTSTGNARLDIVIEGETGINGLGTENGVIADGKYMQNNKVVIVKNGRKYNVTGQLVK